MGFSLNEAVKKLTKTEFAVYASTELTKIKTLTEAQVKSKIKRIEGLIQKATTQKRNTKRKLKTKGMASKVADSLPLKIKFFEKALERLQKELKKMTSKKKATKKKASKKKTSKKKTVKKIRQAPAKKSISVKKKKTRTKSKNPTELNKTGILRKQGHASSRTKRRQGKRDSNN